MAEMTSHEDIIRGPGGTTDLILGYVLYLVAPPDPYSAIVAGKSKCLALSLPSKAFQWGGSIEMLGAEGSLSRDSWPSYEKRDWTEMLGQTAWDKHWLRRNRPGLGLLRSLSAENRSVWMEASLHDFDSAQFHIDSFIRKHRRNMDARMALNIYFENSDGNVEPSPPLWTVRGGLQRWLSPKSSGDRGKGAQFRIDPKDIMVWGALPWGGDEVQAFRWSGDRIMVQSDEYWTSGPAIFPSYVKTLSFTVDEDGKNERPEREWRWWWLETPAGGEWVPAEGPHRVETGEESAEKKGGRPPPPPPRDSPPSRAQKAKESGKHQFSRAKMLQKIRAAEALARKASTPGERAAALRAVARLKKAMGSRENPMKRKFYVGDPAHFQNAVEQSDGRLQGIKQYRTIQLTGDGLYYDGKIMVDSGQIAVIEYTGSFPREIFYQGRRRRKGTGLKRGKGYLLFSGLHVPTIRTRTTRPRGRDHIEILKVSMRD
tara:strand:+ start:1 stop:1455 length:1455 start_codon:yes stop_codon:yes gene_type:complete